MKLATMKFPALHLSILAVSMLFGIAPSGATVVTVGPTGQYASPCAAFPHLADGDTVLIDANNGTPYRDGSDCTISASNLTITGVNGRPILDAENVYISKAIWIENGHDVVIDNFEFRNATTGSGNASAIRIQDSNGGGGTTPAGGNVTVERCYIHNNNEGILGANAGSGGGEWFSANPFILFQYDEFANNGDGSGSTHNMYMGYGGNMTFTMQYSWSHDSFIGHTVKSRAPKNNILYNLIGDSQGATSYVLNFPTGGSTYIVGNTIYKSLTTNADANKAMILWRDVGDNSPDSPVYGTANQDLHFINNTVIDDPGNDFPTAFVNAGCFDATSDTCASPNNGPVLTVPAVVENNIFVGSMTKVSNQASAILRNNILLPNTPANLALLFVDAAHFDFHLIAGSPAISAGIYPPTNNTGAADAAALAVYEYRHPVDKVTRSAPSGSVMDDGAYSYPRVDAPPSPTLSYTQTITAPGTGTITLSGLPAPAAGQFNNAVFVSGNTAAVPTPLSASSSTGTITASFSVNPAVTASTVVPIDIYVGGTHLVANVTVNPGPPVLDSITLDFQYGPYSTVHLQGPAPAGGTVINLTTSDASILYVPVSVTVPAGQISASTNSNTGSLWGPTPFSKRATITATQGSIVKTVDIDVVDPGIHGSGWNQATVVGGQTASYQVTMRGFFPNSGGTFVFTSDNQAVIPNQTFNLPAGNFNDGVNLVTNAVAANTIVNVTLNVNGSICTDNGGCPDTAPITVTPGASAPTVAASSGSGQTAPVNVNFTNALVALVSNGGSPVAGATVTFAGAGVSFPSGATAVTNASGLASVSAQPSSVGALTVTASVAGASTSASFSETGTPAVPGLILNVSEDAYLGDAQFTVTIDGVGTGVTYTATILHSSGNSQPIDLGAVSTGPHTVAVTFLNDAWGGSPSADRNLWVNGATYNGVAISGSAFLLFRNDTQSFSGTFGDALIIAASEDAYQGDAQMTVTVDGVQVGGVYTITASHAAAQRQLVGVRTSLAAGSHTVGVSFINDLWGGSPSADRNLYVLGASYNGTNVPNSAADLIRNSTDTFNVTQ